MEWNLTNERKSQYDSMLKSAKEMEATIGSHEYRMHKLINMRADIDKALKQWWEEVLKEMELDNKKDYMITREGMIRDVTKPEAPVVYPEPKLEGEPTTVGTNASELK